MGDKGDKGFNPEAKFDFGLGKGGDIIDLQKNPFIMQALMKQIQESKLDISHFHPNIRRRIYALKNLHKNTTALEKQYKEEVRALDRKYHALYEPIFAKRAQFVNGDVEPSEEEAKYEEAEKEVENKEGEEELEDGKGIPAFWLTVLQNNRAVSETITPADEDALTHIVDIKSTPLDGAVQGFTLSFHFSENPYFSNNVLTKTYYLTDDEISGDLVFDRVEASKIDWKPAKNLTVKIVTKKQKSKGGRGRKPQIRTKTVEQPIKSFFRFFSPPTWNEEDELEDEEQEELDALLEFDFNLGCIFKDKLIRQAALWFTGEAIDEDDYGDYDEGEYEGGDDEGGLMGDEDDEEEEEEEEDPRPKSKKGASKQQGGAKPSNANTQQPECKQQ
eukprot:TRINITY_DN1148_c0_g1_i1.p1 TRINITY_DN1148_c0_g1~~TRINITY_DN1148_c0_g1_i1.p1  ORF type:complete len:388 (-),score=123.50 TRINITY_DN1148_c0_g1_i1:76-1239(-)